MDKSKIKKVVLAYSGGLDTSIIIPWLKENYNNCEVVAVSGNVGQADELEGLEEKALKTGASKLYVLDLTEEYVNDYIMPCLKAGAIYEDYLLGTSHARPCIAKGLAEIAIKEGGSVGIMSSFNFIGTTWAGGSHALMTEVLRDEWGFDGVAVTDWTNPGTMPVNAGLRAGNDLWLGKNGAYSAKSAYNETPDDIHFLLRQACKRILYSAANSNAVWTAEEYKAVGIDTPPTGNHEALDGYH